MIPLNQKQFFEGSIHLVFAVVIAQGFTIVGKIFIPIDNLFNYNGGVSALALTFVYFFIVTSWYGFFKSVKMFPHQKITKITLARYGIALFNTFILYYMITVTSIGEGLDYLIIFWLVPLYFGMIIAVHLLKFGEREKDRIGVNNQLQKTIGISIVFFAIFIFQLHVYQWIFHRCNSSYLVKYNHSGLM